MRLRTIAAAMACGVALLPGATLAQTPAPGPADPGPATPAGEAASEPPAPGATLAQMTWLAGCWESRDDRDHTEEQWMAPEGRTMIGMSRTVRNGRTIAWENLRIDERDGRLIFTARPSSQPEASFLLQRLDDKGAVFENPDHDFPQRIIYGRGAEGGLAGRIEGTDKGKERSVDFPMKRVPCPGSLPGAASGR